jgi:hypothetical protein
MAEAGLMVLNILKTKRIIEKISINEKTTRSLLLNRNQETVIPIRPIWAVQKWISDNLSLNSCLPLKRGRI